MFAYASLIFLIFSALYALFLFAAWYHIDRFAFAPKLYPRVVALFFSAIIGLLWFGALFFLLQLS